jgi:hypothetical protein
MKLDPWLPTVPPVFDVKSSVTHKRQKVLDLTSGGIQSTFRQHAWRNAAMPAHARNASAFAHYSTSQACPQGNRVELQAPLT